jgi:hypothetical protein
MPDTVNVPLLGKTPKGGVMAGGAALVVVGGYLWYKHLQKKAAATTATTPAAGYGYGYGYGSQYAYGYGGYSPYGFGGGGFPFGYGYGGPPPSPGGGNPITTNAEWFQAVTADLGSSGTDHVGAVLSSYLAGVGIAKSDQITVMEAEGFEGPPPVAGPDGFPPKIRVTSGGNGGGGGNAVNPVTGLHVTHAGSTSVDIAWKPSKGATSYQVTSTHGTPEMTGTTTARIRSINPPGHPSTASVQVLAEPAASGAKAATIQVKTTRR